MNPDERTTGMGLWTDAHDMIAAAEVVSNDMKRLHGSSPMYFLAGHGIEEAFKAYLRARGSSLSELKYIGHDLEDALEAAICRGIEHVCVLSDQDKAMLSVLNLSYKAKHFEYRVTGFKQLPQIQDLLDFANRVLTSIKPICEVSIGVRRA